MSNENEFDRDDETENKKLSVKDQFKSLPKSSKNVVKVTLVVMVVIFIIIFASYSGEDEVDLGTQELAAGASVPSVPQDRESDNDNTTPIYDRALAELERQKKVKAKESDESYIPPVPDAEEWQISAEPESEPVVTVITKQVELGMTPQEKQEVINSKKAFMAKMLSTWGNKGNANTTKVVFMDTQGQVYAASDTDQASSGDSAQPEKPVRAKRGIRPGDIMIANVDIGINTDAISKTKATILQGPLAGAVFIGDPRRTGERVNVEYNTITYGDFSSPIHAVAIDRKLANANIAEGVDTHTAYRWSMLGISAMLEGANEYLNSNQGNNVSAVNGVVIEQKDKYEAKDLYIAGVTKIGSKASSIAEREFDTPPTVTVPANTMIGIMFTEAFDADWLPDLKKLEAY